MNSWWLEICLPWLKVNWRNIGLGAGLLFMVGYFRQCGQLSACQNKLSQTETVLSQAADQKQDLKERLEASAQSGGKVILRPGPSRPCPQAGECPPCPEAEIVFQSTGASTGQSSGVQSQALSQTAQDRPKSSEKAFFSLRLGGGVSSPLDSVNPHGMAEISAGKISIYGFCSIDKQFGTGATYEVLAW